MKVSTLRSDQEEVIFGFSRPRDLSRTQAAALMPVSRGNIRDKGSLQHLHNMRGYELNQTLPLLRSGSRILEVGAGTGWQAKALAEKGFSVVAIDTPGNPYAQERLWPVLEYDGINLPFPDRRFDIVFSSHVLEHISHAEQFQAELRRVLKPEGMAIHVLPTATWRFWTSICFYAHLAKILVRVLFPSLRPDDPVTKVARAKESSLRQSVNIKALFPSRHGEIGNALSESYLFSRFRWRNLFHTTGWTVTAYYPSRLFYTGHMVLGSKLSLKLRHKASYILGSSSHLFCLRKAD